MPGSEMQRMMEVLQQAAAPLISWYRKNRRQMAWRENPLPYYVWVSEIMLQQTRVEAVRPYFDRFIRRLPDIASLAVCPEDTLLKLWEGLGYYNRVRNMQKAARIIMDDYSGQLPEERAILLKLPGIGSYTAGAIASIAYGQKTPAVDGNVLRVLSRLTGSHDCIDDPKVRRFWEEKMECVLSGCEEPGTLNQALMELGALICLPNGMPKCSGCPLSEFCAASLENMTDLIPVRAARKARRIEQKTVFVIRDPHTVLIRRRPAKGLLAGLWELPNADGFLSQEEALRQVEKYGVKPVQIRKLVPAEHVFTHIEWKMEGYLILAEEFGDLKKGYLTADADSVKEKYAIPAAFSCYTAYIVSSQKGSPRFKRAER